MVIILYGPTAYQHWLHAAHRPRRAGCHADPLRLDCKPTEASLDYLAATLPHLDEPYHLMVTANLRPGSRLVPHRCDARLPRGTLLPVAHGVYAASPELCLVQLGRYCPVIQLAKAAIALCGTAAIRQDARYGTEQRTPLAACTALRSFAARNSALHGARAAQRAAGLAADGARSPAEADLFLRLTLPYRLGGKALSRPRLNYPVPLTEHARRLAGQASVIADLAWPASRVAVEYDSNLTHLAIAQHTRDVARRDGMEAAGWKTMTVTADHLYGSRGMESLARELARALGERIRPRAASHRQREDELRALPRGYDLPPDFFL